MNRKGNCSKDSITDTHFVFGAHLMGVIKVVNYLMSSLEHECSAQMVPKLGIGHVPQPDPSIRDPHKPFP
jgi:hypothetical protein